MCGINGIISNKNLDLKGVLTQMNSSIIHRGPDDEGFFTCAGSKTGMAMRRLSIIDLQTGKQPVFTENRDKVIVFNGEIYNYKILREQLILKGYTFSTRSDTEVVLNLFDCYGVESFSMLDGMFAFSIYDKLNNTVVIARDFFGEKPLYYFKNNEKFIWASELKSILNILPIKPIIDKEALNIYFQLTYVPAPFTIYEGIKKLEANTYMTINCNDLSFKIEDIIHKHKEYDYKSKAEAITITHDLVMESVASRAISDVPIGAFLSGGVDSSIISLCLAHHSSNKIDTFSIGFEKKSFDERDKSRKVAKILKSNHHEFVIGENDLIKDFSKILLNFDEPFADSSALPSYIVANKTKEFSSVALTGDGGDEVFGGYNKYYIGKLNQRYTSIVPNWIHEKLMRGADFALRSSNDDRGLRFKANRLLKAINYDGDFYLNIISLGFTPDELRQILIPEYYSFDSLSFYKDKIGNKNKTLSDFRNIDKLLSLEGDMLTKVDRTSMLNSLECRAPFLNKEIWNFTNQLPDHYLINNWDKKHLLKEAFKNYFPSDFLNKSKKGFGVPVGDWLRSNFKVELLSYIEESFLRKQSIFQSKEIKSLVLNHINGKQDNTFRVWSFFCFQKWYIDKYEN